MKIEICDDCVDQIVAQELRNLLAVVHHPDWESDDVEADIAAIDRILSYYEPIIRP